MPIWKIPFEYRDQVCDIEGVPLVSSTGEPLVTVSNLLLEGCKVVCNGGIRTERKGTKDVHSMVYQYDLNDPDVDKFCGRRVDLKHIVMKSEGLLSKIARLILASRSSPPAKIMSIYEEIASNSFILILRGSFIEIQSYLPIRVALV
jgi:hypothetical protein